MNVHLSTEVEYLDGTKKECIVRTAAPDLVAVERHFKTSIAKPDGLTFEHMAYLTWRVVGNGQSFDDWLGTVAMITVGDEGAAEVVPTPEPEQPPE